MFFGNIKVRALFFAFILEITVIGQSYAGGYTAEFIFGDDTNTIPFTKPIVVRSINLKTATIDEIKVDEKKVTEIKNKIIYPGQILKIKISDKNNENFISLEEEDDAVNQKISQEKFNTLFQSIIFEVEKEEVPFYWAQRSPDSLYFQSYSKKYSWNTFMRSLPQFNRKNNAYHHAVECSFLEQEK